MNKTNELPEILEAHWDREQVHAFFDDLENGADILHIQVRATSTAGPQDHETTLDEARHFFDSPTARAIQIRYTFDGQCWCDTLMVLPESIRIIRTRGT